MDKRVRRLFVEKRGGFDVEGEKLYKDFKDYLNIEGLKKVRVINRYDVEGISEEEYKKSIKTIFSEPNVDIFYEEDIKIDENSKIFAYEYLPGQYDQRADSAAQCIQILTQKEKPIINSAKVIVLEGNISNDDFVKIKNYTINPVDSREASLDKPSTLIEKFEIPEEVITLDGFIDKDEKGLKLLKEDMGLAMSYEDLRLCQQYFKDKEKRNPTITEIKVIDTYWSDHCRHTTFLTEIEEVKFEEGVYNKAVERAFKSYLSSRDYVYKDKKKDMTLMDIATIEMKEQRKKGILDNLDISDEVNACSIKVDVDIDGVKEPWLIMFKNETHNHPTEIEPFGGAATCLGGAIRDPLSGRSYVYQAMRVSGSGDPRRKLTETLPGKLPQRKITQGAALGYSSYGNQIGIATGHVSEIYDEGYVAKRMEIGAVIGAAPEENVIRKEPKDGDVVLIVGGRTGRDGCGGATGSSKIHTEESITSCGAEVQKGNPPTERKIQRLFRNSKLSKLIKRCNDFGAGGVAVAIGELADSLDINLDKVPKKYKGLDGTELAISESQERMAVVIDKENLDKFNSYCEDENLEVTVVAKVTSTGRLKMSWNGKDILDISREFLDTNGAKQKTEVLVGAPDENNNYLDRLPKMIDKKNKTIKDLWLENLQDLNNGSQKGLVERFDSTIGGNTVLMPFGGEYELTPTEGMVAKVPVLNGDTNTCTIMGYGFDPKLSKWSPFYGGVYSVVHSVAKVVAMGGDYSNVRLTLQEYFEKLGKDKRKWGKPFSALLGAFEAQKELDIPAIGGKDSMSGTFKDIHVPPTLVSFAVGIGNVEDIISPEFKGINNNVVLIPMDKRDDGMPNFDTLKKNFKVIHKAITDKKVISAHTVGYGGIASAISKMSFGNKIGITFDKDMDINKLFKPDYGSIILEVNDSRDLEDIFTDIDYINLGKTNNEKIININNERIDIDLAIDTWLKPLDGIFKLNNEKIYDKEKIIYKGKETKKIKSKINIAKPRVFIPVFPGTNCEYDTEKAFKVAGGNVDSFVFKNLTGNNIEDSIETMVKKINNSQIIALPGGFSAGDEPDGSGKFIATVFRNPRIKEAVMDLLNNRDGLILGICNGFQALIKLGLVPFGEIRDLERDAPALTFNKIGRHISSIAKTKIVSNKSPWLSKVSVGDIHTIPISHGEGRFMANEKYIEKMKANGQIATQYASHNPNGSVYAIEGITSPDGRVFGKMAHSERRGNLYRNIPGNNDQKIFEAGIEYYK